MLLRRGRLRLTGNHGPVSGRVEIDLDTVDGSQVRVRTAEAAGQVAPWLTASLGIPKIRSASRSSRPIATGCSRRSPTTCGPPRTPGPAYLWVVLRDSRGGRGVCRPPRDDRSVILAIRAEVVAHCARFIANFP